jgi:hypothetical protein
MVTVTITKIAGAVNWTLVGEGEQPNVELIDYDCLDDAMAVTAIRKLAAGPGGERWGQLLGD